MGIKVYWEDEKQTILRFDFAATWDGQDCMTAARSAGTLLTRTAETQDAIAVIFHIPESNPLPVRMLPLLRHVLKLAIDQRWAFVVVTDDVLLRICLALTHEFYAYFNVTVLPAGTIEEARAILYQRPI